MSWDISALLAKAITLMAMVSVVGGFFCLYLTVQYGSQVRQYLLRYIKVGAFIGLIASSLYFFIQVGAFSQTGLSGMLDKTMLTILGQSGLGYASMSRVSAFALILALITYKTWQSKNDRDYFGFASIVVLTLAGILLAYSFSLIGHVAELQTMSQLAIELHVLAISLWVGSLLPLWHLCNVERIGNLKKIMVRFGELAIGFVAVLILSGIYLLVQLVQSPTELFRTSYGIALMIKLTGVSVLLLLGAVNKLRLVPALEGDEGVRHLKKSIQLETSIACVVLFVTAYLTTLVGM